MESQLVLTADEYLVLKTLKKGASPRSEYEDKEDIVSVLLDAGCIRIEYGSQFQAARSIALDKAKLIISASHDQILAITKTGEAAMERFRKTRLGQVWSYVSVLVGAVLGYFMPQIIRLILCIFGK